MPGFTTESTSKPAISIFRSAKIHFHSDWAQSGEAEKTMDSNTVAEYLKQEIQMMTNGKHRAAQIGDGAEILGELALDSLDYAMLMLAGESRFKVKVDEASVDWREVRTIADLAALLSRSRSIA